MSKKRSPLVDKILRNAIVIPNPDGPDWVTLVCEMHGGCCDPYGPTVGNCPECNAVWLLVRESFLRDVEKPQERPQLSTLARAVANACQSEREGTLDFLKYGAPTVKFVPDEPASRVTLTDGD